MNKKVFLLTLSTLLIMGLVGCKKNDPKVIVDSISFDEELFKLEEGSDLNLLKVLTITPESVADTITIDWASTPSDMVAISRSGMLTALKAGTATVTATAGGKSATCTIKISEVAITDFKLASTAKGVIDIPLKVDLSVMPKKAHPSHIDLKFVGAGASDISYYFEGANLYVLTSKPGSYTLNASYGTLPTQTCNITVTAKLIESVSLSPLSVGGEIGFQQQLSLSVTPADATYANVISYSSDNKSVATVSSQGLVTVVGDGVATITVKVGKAEGGEKVYTATCKVTTIVKAKDICGNTYTTTLIGSQLWMAENLKCNKYDTQSEAYKSGLKNIPAYSGTSVYTPVYIDATDKSRWTDYEKKYSKNLTDEMIAKFGYRYNWAAAVGINDGKSQTNNFSGIRQGVCPNGWHMPTHKEWEDLGVFIEQTDGKGSSTAGIHLKSIGGWYDKEYPKPGKDTYGFAALPATTPGYSAIFWSVSHNDEKAFVAELEFDSSRFFLSYLYKFGMFGVRCLHN